MDSDRIRNIALIGHQGNGKTTLAEAILYCAGVVNRPGSVESGSTVLDTQPEEHDRCQSLSLGLASFRWGEHHINLVDTPGYADFVGEALTALRVCDVAVLVVDAVSGLQPNDELLWHEAGTLGVPRLIFVNRMDKERSSFERTLDGLRSHFGSAVEPVKLPVIDHDRFLGIADLLTEHAFLYDTGSAVETEDLPADLADREHAEHEHLVEDVVEIDDDLLARYLDGEEIGVEDLEAALHTGFVRGDVWPVLCGSATEPIGVDRLVEFICHVAPNPTERPGLEVIAGDTLIEVACDPDGEPLGHVFKSLTDDYVGRLRLVKVVSGTIRTDDVLVNPRTGSTERLHNLLRLVGADHTPVETAVAGDIIGMIKLSDVVSGDTLAPVGSPVVVPPVSYPQPVYGLGVSVSRAADEEKLATALHELVYDDPALSVARDDDTGQTVIRGSGDVHLQVTLARIRRRYGIDLETAPVEVAYRETLAASVEVEGRHKKQSGGRGQYGVAVVRFEPLPRGTGFEFVDDIHGGVIPKGLIPAVGRGIEESMARGGDQGYRMVDIRATVIDGKHHSVDSDEMSFRMAGARALRAAIEQVGTVVLEPVTRLEVTAPMAMQGDIAADLGGRRAQIQNSEPGTGDEVRITAMMPTSEIDDYAVALRSMTSGRGRCTMAFDHYQDRPNGR